MNFGKWIVVAFVSFALFIATLVTICVRQDINLVSENYYREELVHQDKMDFIQNTKLLSALPQISADNNIITVSFSEFDKIEKGELRILRPSDKRLDKKFIITATKDKSQHYSLNQWNKGLYRASMQWTMNGKEFYFEKLIVI
ncbi:MAG: FixH family protein [Cyclobacteriaceae bacterium]